MFVSPCDNCNRKKLIRPRLAFSEKTRRVPTVKQSAYTAYYQTERVAFFFDRREPEELALNRDISLLTAKIYSRATLDGVRARAHAISTLLDPRDFSKRMGERSRVIVSVALCSGHRPFSLDHRIFPILFSTQDHFPDRIASRNDRF